MMANRNPINAEHIDLSRCYAKIDKFNEAADRRRRANAHAAIRASDDSPWLVLRVMTGKELIVRDALIEADIEALVPMKMGKEMRKRHRIIAPKYEPVFVGYIFARCIICNESLAALLAFEHVLSVLGGYETPYIINADKVNVFNEKAIEGHFDYEVPQQVFRRGMKVLIKDGIFAGSTGEIVTGGHTGKGNAVVDINFLGRATPAIMPLAILSPL